MRLASLFKVGLFQSFLTPYALSSTPPSIGHRSLLSTVISLSTPSQETQSPSTRLMSQLPPLPGNSRRLYILRHGQTDWNRQGLIQGGSYDIELNENGRKQAELVAQELASLPIRVVASSHLRRARETADIVARGRQGTKRVVLEGFGEMRFGSFEGMAVKGPSSTEETRAKFSAVNDQMRLDANARCPGDGESTAEVEARARKALEEILADHPDDQHIAVVAHGRTNKVLLASLIYDDALRYNEIPQGNTCINVVDQDESGKWNCRILNYVGHYEPAST